MKTVDQLLGLYTRNTLDGRDISRLAQFLTEEQMGKLGIELKEEYKGKHKPVAFTKENVLEELKSDVEFGFTKARNGRGISASLMFNVVMMWNWILEDGLEDWDEGNYAPYGLPLFEATAAKYGFDVE
ncbi:hypothetical protein [Bacillus mycoides]|uniref:hypothetical protein n=1 Tax=Bacillus mycoides TaxID=1405 RepID=UPI003A81188E